MAMTQDQFAALVSRLEASARRDPRGYKLRVLLLACAGYAYLWLVVVGLVLLCWALLAFGAYLNVVVAKVGFAVVAVLWMVLRAMVVRIRPPEGRAIARTEAPALFLMIDSLRRRCRAPSVHRVLVTDELNAAIAQVPVLGLLGWRRNYLVVGLPLMKLLTLPQFEAVLAHEFGHLAGGHGRTSNWIYRSRLAWMRLLPALENANSLGSFAIKPFLTWYIPFFNAYSFPLARANEYEADAASARLAS